MFDIIVKDGRIVDGTGNPWCRGDLGIRGERIVSIGQLDPASANEIIDVKGLVVSPGFIDSHCHSDMCILYTPKMEHKVFQGVTTEIGGQCGYSAGPFKKETIDQFRPYLKTLALEEYTFDWLRLGEFFDRLEQRGIAMNLASHVGHSTLRATVMGFEDRAPTKEELEEMKTLERQAMADGAIGLSVGLVPMPGPFATFEELVELAKVAVEYNRYLSIHVRGEGDTVIEAIKEAIAIGEKTGIPVDISHMKAIGKENWGKVRNTLQLIEQARAKGLDVTCDQYPYTAMNMGLVSTLPPWTLEGGIEKLLERLKDRETRNRMRKHMEEGLPDWPENFVRSTGWEKIMVNSIKSEKNQEVVGKFLSEIAQMRGVDPFEATFDLLLEEEGAVFMAPFALSEEDVQTVMGHPVTMIGSDSVYVSTGNPHPRVYGTFPRVLGTYVREKGVLTLENAIRKMTSFPAQLAKLKDRGVIRVGMYADLVIFDPQRVEAKSTFAEPRQYPEGIEYVLINGKVVIKKGQHTGVLAGKVIKP